MGIFGKKIATKRVRRWVVVLICSLAVLTGFQTLTFLTGVYQIGLFLKVGLAFYIFLIFMTSFIFDLKLKIPASWERSSKYYQYNKQNLLQKYILIVMRSLSSRFHYLFVWRHWRHFQNYLILPAALYWAVVLLIFLNSFDEIKKQLFAVSGALLLAIIIWHLKIIFVGYGSSGKNTRLLMFTVMISTAFLVYSALLGITWYSGLPVWHFPIAAGLGALFFTYQSIFHHPHINTPKNFIYVLVAACLIGLSAIVVQKFWTVNYYTAGLVLTAVLNFYWSSILQLLQNKLTLWKVLEYLVIFAAIIFYALLATNFGARIG